MERKGTKEWTEREKGWEEKKNKSPIQWISRIPFERPKV